MTINNSRKEEMADHTGATVPRTSSDEEEKEEETYEERGTFTKNLMDASDTLTSMRTVIEEQMKQIQPPMPLYTRPLQRQHWGDVQVTPHKEWGDIFFDLFYVAGAYNLGNMLKEEPTFRGLCYFVAAFSSLQNLWQYKMFFDSRFFVPNNDMFHNFYEMCTLVVLGTAVLYCRPVAILSHPEEHNDLFIFCCSLLIAMLLLIGRSLEVIWMIEGGVESTGARVASKRDATQLGIIAAVQAAAAIYAGVKYYSNDHDYHGSDNSYGYEDSHYDSGNSSDYYNNNYTDSSTEYHGEEDGHHFRFLAGDSSYGEEKESTYSGDVSMELLVAGYLANHLLTVILLTFVIPRVSGGDHTRVTVPMNVDYAIHRYGEWIMLMLGESVLSLLIVGAQQDYNYYKTFYCGIISISLLQFMHFQSQPHHADDHAIRRKKERGYLFVVMVQIYSGALIILGASYKMMLYEFVYRAEYAKAAGYEEEEDNGYHRMLLPALGAKLQRLLAGGGGGALRFDADDREQRIANFFCGSMATIWFLCDMLILVHKGIKEHMDRCQECEHSKWKKLLSVPLLLARVGLVAFMATLSLYQTDPSFIAFTGLVGIVAQVILRFIGTALYRKETEEDHFMAELKSQGFKSTEFKLD
ncbi:expressed unknown protein [Seminavis robusta]|uniref:Uncharacterized protein n=1 Tax=Seminavis robusta TaxID=568900 RepID=A0A9N8EP51_9STRA|nr:expressed unknown protein [Seminavis robusta]|eukprot:Sro1673_g290210.1 n/a (637) ;mRNA; r:3594-6025